MEDVHYVIDVVRHWNDRCAFLLVTEYPKYTTDWLTAVENNPSLCSSIFTMYYMYINFPIIKFQNYIYIVTSCIHVIISSLYEKRFICIIIVYIHVYKSHVFVYVRSDGCLTINFVLNNFFESCHFDNYLIYNVSFFFFFFMYI